MTHLLGKHDNEKVIPSRVKIKINGRRVGVHKYNKRGNKNIQKFILKCQVQTT